MTFSEVAASGMNMVGTLAVVGVTAKVANNIVKSVPKTKSRKVISKKSYSGRSPKKIKGIFR